MKLRYWLPLVYFVAGMCLVFVFGGAGHGWGGEAFFYIGLPVSLLAENTKENVIWSFVFGIIQWGLVGYVIERLVKRK